MDKHPRKPGSDGGGMKKKEDEKTKDPARQSWYNVKRMAQRIMRHPEEAGRILPQIISTAEAEIDKAA